MIPLIYFRSSSWGTHDACGMQYYLQYILGMENLTNKAMIKGSIVHKALEGLASKKLCLQNNQTSFIDDSLGEMDISDCSPDNLIGLSYDWHSKQFSELNWDNKRDFRECKNWMYLGLNFQGGIFNPLNRTIIAPEQKFDFEIKKPWAKYNYKFENGVELSGFLSLRGTMDLITEVKPGIIEIIDWKTGATRNDFATGKTKEFDTLHQDPQLRLYHYAAHHIFPAIDEIIMTIFYVRAGGPFTLMLSKDDLPETEEIIRKKFDEVRRTTKPKLTPNPPWSSRPNPKTYEYKCMKHCKFSQQSTEDPSKTTCQFFNDKIGEAGIEKVTEKYMNFNKLNYYEGGGKSGR